MLELDSMNFLRAATMLARLNQIMATLTAARDELLVPESVERIIPALSEFRREADVVGAKLAVIAIDRIEPKVKEEPCQLTVGQAFNALSEIESRFADYMSDVKMIALAPGEAVFMEGADSLVEREGFSITFPSASFEIEEASKCLVLGRHTAAVFHAMRMLEYGIRALSKRLDIEDPTRAAEKNWGVILGAIQRKIDELWPRQGRMPNSEGAQFEKLHAHLETVRNPWRNATMHVETIYAPHEALHILRCSAFFMVGLSKLIDENGDPIDPGPRLPMPGDTDGEPEHQIVRPD